MVEKRRLQAFRESSVSPPDVGSRPPEQAFSVTFTTGNPGQEEQSFAQGSGARTQGPCFWVPACMGLSRGQRWERTARDRLGGSASHGSGRRPAVASWPDPPAWP